MKDYLWASLRELSGMGLGCYSVAPQDLHSAFIYLLIREGEVVYVGESFALFGRLIQHQKDKIFDRVVYFDAPAEKEQRRRLEAMLIQGLEPEYNKKKGCVEMRYWSHDGSEPEGAMRAFVVGAKSFLAGEEVSQSPIPPDITTEVNPDHSVDLDCLLEMLGAGLVRQTIKDWEEAKRDA